MGGHTGSSGWGWNTTQFCCAWSSKSTLGALPGHWPNLPFPPGRSQPRFWAPANRTRENADLTPNRASSIHLVCCALCPFRIKVHEFIYSEVLVSSEVYTWIWLATGSSWWFLPVLFESRIVKSNSIDWPYGLLDFNYGRKAMSHIFQPKPRYM